MMITNKSKIFKDIAEFCHSGLLKDKSALSYLCDERGLSMETINKFQLGLFPSELKELFAKVNPKDLRDVEIIRHASKSKFRFWDIIIPICDVYGNHVAIAGRTRLSKDKQEKYKIHAKYNNSIYSKAHHLYGLNIAKQSIIEKDLVYVTEGYFDVMTAHQHGLKNIVAVCGAFLTMRHIVLLARYTNNIVIIFDNEVPAQERARKIMEKRQQNGILIKVYNPFPNDINDLDEYFRKRSSEILNKLEVRGTYDDIEPLWKE